jgi:hypothetical protein
MERFLGLGLAVALLSGCGMEPQQVSVVPQGAIVQSRAHRRSGSEKQLLLYLGQSQRVSSKIVAQTLIL